MAQPLKHYVNLAKRMIQYDKNRDAMFLQQDAMWRREWTLPEGMEDTDWIRKVVSTDGHDAVRAGTRVLSALDERIKVLPLSEEADERERVARVGKALKWHLSNAARRRRTSVRRDLVLSALRYDEICAKVVFLPHHLKTIKDLGGDTRRVKAAMRYGPFAIMVENPRSVHTRYSDLMPEAVVQVSVKPIDELIAFWGKAASDIKKALKQDESIRYAVEVDYMDHGERAVFAFLQASSVMPPTDLLGEKAYPIIEPMKHDLQFLPWVCRTGGTTLEADAKDQRIPLLYSIYDYWVNQSILQTILLSEVISYAAAPRIEIESMNPDAVEVDYNEPNRPIVHDTQSAVRALNPPQIDAAVATLEQFFGGAIEKATVAKILQGGQIPAGAAYATLNLATLTALGTLKPYKELAELGLSDILMQMLLWVHYSGKGVKALGTGKKDTGKVYEIRPSDVDPDNIHIIVELEPDLPVDRQQRINAAATAVERLGMSQASALEQVGVTDPEAEIERGMREQTVNYYWQKSIQLDQAQTQLAMQQAQVQMQQAQMAQQQQGAPMGPQGIPGVGGQQWNPAEGGMPAQVGAPGATREMQAGRTRTGEEALG